MHGNVSVSFSAARSALSRLLSGATSDDAAACTNSPAPTLTATTDAPATEPADCPACDPDADAAARPPAAGAAARATDAVATLHAHAAASDIPCALPRAGMRRRLPLTLARHLTPDHATPSIHAAFAFTSCLACDGTFCLLPRDTTNGDSHYLTHIKQKCKDHAHQLIRSQHGKWDAAQTAARRAVINRAPPGTLGATLAAVTATAIAPAAITSSLPPPRPRPSVPDFEMGPASRRLLDQHKSRGERRRWGKSFLSREGK